MATNDAQQAMHDECKGKAALSNLGLLANQRLNGQLN
jgi:hypothetical protein